MVEVLNLLWVVLIEASAIYSQGSLILLTSHVGEHGFSTTEHHDTAPWWACHRRSCDAACPSCIRVLD